MGGKQVVLPKLFKETGFDNLLQEIARDKVIFGTSAGANILGRNIDIKEYWEDQYGTSDEYLEYPSLGLVNFNIIPHFGRGDRPRRTVDVLKPLLVYNPFPVYGINDEQAVVYDNGELKYIGGRPIIFGNIN